MKSKIFIILFAIGALFFIGCKNSEKEKGEPEPNVTDISEEGFKQMYQVEISPLNSHITGSDAIGKAVFEIENDEVHVRIEMSGTPPNMEHWQHFHGFEDETDASCPTMDADKNGDGIIDLIETEDFAGTTMVPFNDVPAEMDIPKNSYPVSDKNGNYKYEVTISLTQLEKAFGDAFNDTSLQLEKRVLFIHGVPSETDLPESVASLGDIPAQVTLPIGCGKFVRVQ